MYWPLSKSPSRYSSTLAASYMPPLMYPGRYLSALAASYMPQRPLRLKCFSGRNSDAALTAVQYSSAFMHTLLCLVERLGSDRIAWYHADMYRITSIDRIT